MSARRIRHARLHAGAHISFHCLKHARLCQCRDSSLLTNWLERQRCVRQGDELVRKGFGFELLRFHGYCGLRRPDGSSLLGGLGGALKLDLSWLGRAHSLGFLTSLLEQQLRLLLLSRPPE